ncbi:MAG: hypothetical protein WC728_00585 [Elusimicrobiota bacterium]
MRSFSVFFIGAWVGLMGAASAQEPASAPEFSTGRMEAAAPPPGMRGKPINLPDISVIGVLAGHLSDEESDRTKERFEFEEVETAFQGFLYPEMRADVFLALHKHGSEYEAEICEAKATFLHLAEGLSASVGKLHVDFGKLNKAHTHHRPMIDQPQAITNFLGHHGLVGQGGVASYLLPLPFYVQADAAFWRVPGEAEEDEYSLDDETFTGKLKTSFAPGSKSEFELGGSFASGYGAHNEFERDRAKVYGADLTFKAWPSSYERWTFQNEYFRLVRKGVAGRLYRDGLYSFLNYRVNKYWDVGGRFDYAEGAFPEQSIERSYSAMGGYHFTETTRAMVQYKHRRVDGISINEGWLQLAFGIGPHSHELE